MRMCVSLLVSVSTMCVSLCVSLCVTVCVCVRVCTSVDFNTMTSFIKILLENVDGCGAHLEGFFNIVCLLLSFICFFLVLKLVFLPHQPCLNF